MRPFASTVLVVANGDTAITGNCQFGGHNVELTGARGAQTHLWGTKHAESWSWARCGEFRTESGERTEDTFVDGGVVVQLTAASAGSWSSKGSLCSVWIQNPSQLRT